MGQEPDNTPHMRFLHEIFPNAKFVYMIRDGRDSAYSYFTRELDAYNTSQDLSWHLDRWNRVNEIANEACESMGERQCYRLKYEQLVDEPEPFLRELVEFLDLPWTDNLLHHDKFLAQNKLNISSDPIYKNFPRSKITNKSVGKWKGNVPEFENETFLEQYPMLSKLNYA